LDFFPFRKHYGNTSKKSRKKYLVVHQLVIRAGAIRAKQLSGVGAAALMLLFIGIHNALDSIVYLVLFIKQKTNNDRRLIRGRKS